MRYSYNMSINIHMHRSAECRVQSAVLVLKITWYWYRYYFTWFTWYWYSFTCGILWYYWYWYSMFSRQQHKTKDNTPSMKYSIHMRGSTIPLWEIPCISAAAALFSFWDVMRCEVHRSFFVFKSGQYLFFSFFFFFWKEWQKVKVNEWMKAPTFYIFPSKIQKDSNFFSLELGR